MSGLFGSLLNPRDIDGFGHQYCYLDGERRQNDGDFMCKSPINAQV
jgi:hypothetical protein